MRAPRASGRRESVHRTGRRVRRWMVCRKHFRAQPRGRLAPLLTRQSPPRTSPPGYSHPSQSTSMNEQPVLSREQMVELLNEDLAREYQAIIAYVVYSQTIKGAEYTDIAGELAIHASEELDHAIQIASQIDYFNGTPTTIPNPVQMSEKPEDMLRFDLENERVTILNYRQRIRQAEAMGEFALSEVLRKIIAQEQEHLTDLADALGIDTPNMDE